MRVSWEQFETENRHQQGTGGAGEDSGGRAPPVMSPVSGLNPDSPPWRPSQKANVPMNAHLAAGTKSQSKLNPLKLFKDVHVGF